MGSYNQYRIFGDTKNDAVLEGKIEVFLANRPNDGSCLDVWGGWTASSKWYAGDLALQLSKEFPTVMFRYEQQGESGFGRWFYLNGVEVEEGFVCQFWPSTNAFKSGVKKQAVYYKQRAQTRAKVLAEKAEKDRLEKIAKLEGELKTLKKTG